MREHKIRDGVKLQGALGKKDIKQGLGVTGKPRDLSSNKCG